MTIAKGAKAFVALVLQQTRAPNPFHNSAPQIDAVSASSDSVEPGGSVTVTARASDPDGDPLTFSWSSPSGSFADGAAGTTTWTAGAEGTPTLTLRVRDSKGASAAISFVMNVHATAGTGIASISASFNDAPMVQSMTIDQTPLDVGQTAHLGLTATDIDGDAITSYAWTSTGTFADATAAAPAFTLSALPAAGRSCAFSVKIIDARGGWNTGELSIQTGAQIDVSKPPVVDTTFQAADVAAGGQSLTFRVKGHEPEGTTVAYSWSSAVGTLAAATTTANGESEVVWTAPACFIGAALVSATLTDASGASTTQAFNVTAGVSNCPPRPIQIASVSTAGALSNGFSEIPAMSADGRYVAFASGATNLGAATANFQVYLHDAIAGTTTVVSALSDGTPGNSSSLWASISGDGRYVAFVSVATNFGGAGANVFVRDMQAGTLALVTSLPNSTLDSGPALSLDGRHVCFSTTAPLDPSDTNGARDVYWKDLETGTLRRVSTQPTARFCAISTDGRRVSFTSVAALVAADTNNSLDIYARDMVTDELTLVTDGVHAFFDDRPHAMSANGQFVAFVSSGAMLGEGIDGGTSVYVRDLGTSALRAGSDRPSHRDADWPSLSADGNVVAFIDSNAGGPFQAFTRDFATGLLTLQSTSAAGAPADQTVFFPALSADGHYVSFLSRAANLVDNDTNGQYDIFVAPRR